MAGELAGRRIVVPESRELDLFVAMLEREGAEAIRCPLVRILDVVDEAPVAAWLETLRAGGFDDLVLYTGEGVKRLCAVAEREGLRDAFVASLARARRIVRGPKPTRVLRTLGLAPDIQAEPATTAGLMAALGALDLSGRRIGIQAYPDLPDAIDGFLRERGATVARVLPYRYADDREDHRVADVIARMAAGEVDLIAFTSRPQVERLVAVAAARDLAGALADAMGRVLVASVGPVTTEAVRKAGWPVAAEPADNFHLKPFVGTMRALMADRPRAGAASGT